MSDVPATSVRDATIARGGNQVLNAISFDVAEGAFHCIIGPNGAGKSTLISLLAGDLASESVIIHGTPLTHMSHAERAKARAVVRTLGPHEFGYQVAEFIELCDVPGGSAKMQLSSSEILRLCNLEPLRNRPITQLSSGQLARVHMAGALRQNTGIILADEPEAALDPIARVAIWQTMIQSNRTIVVATHSLDLVMQFATHVTAIVDGAITLSEPRATITLEKLEQVFRTA